jgi:hypothetical protein
VFRKNGFGASRFRCSISKSCCDFEVEAPALEVWGLLRVSRAPLGRSVGLVGMGTDAGALVLARGDSETA